MKTKYLFLVIFVLTITSMGFAQTKTTLSAPELVVKNLYAAQKNKRTAPFFQYAKWALVNQYFTKDLGDLIWKDATAAKGEVGALDFDPLFYSQDQEITSFVIGKPKEAVSPDFANIPVTFKNFGKTETVEFEVMREKGSIWKVNNIIYSDGEDLNSILSYGTDPQALAEFESNMVIGDYLIGARKCNVMPTKGGYAHKFQCADQKKVQVYWVEHEGNDNEIVFRNEKGVEQGKFTFKDKKFVSGTFLDAKGKNVKVSRVN